MPYSREGFSLADLIRKHIAGHPYLYSSIAAHAVVLLLFYYLYSVAWSKDQHYVNSPDQKKIIEHSVHETKIMAMQNNVQELRKIKKLLDESFSNNSQEKSHHSPEKPTKDDSIDNQTFESLLTEAKKISDEIKSVESSAKAEELARLLNISTEEALKKIAGSALKKKDEESKTDAVKTIEELKKEAKEILLQRKQHMEQQKNGTKITSGNGSKQPHHSKRDGNEGGNVDAGAGSSMTEKLSTIDEKMEEYFNVDQAMANDAGKASDILFDSGLGAIPEINAPVLYKNKGRVLGASGDYSNRFYVNSWFIIGPFDGNDGRGVFSNSSYPPEEAIKLDAVYEGKNNRFLHWEYVSSDIYPLIPPDPEEDAVYYGYTELKSDRDIDYCVWIGADDDVRIWLNERVVYSGGNTRKSWFFLQVSRSGEYYVHDWNLTEAKKLMHFKSGNNKILFKLSNGPKHVYFSMVLSSDSCG